MRNRIQKNRRGSDRVVMNLASMIDVSFLLLFYFMMATMIHDRENRLSAGLQTQAGGPGSLGDFQTQNIEVRLNGLTPIYAVGTNICTTREELRSILEPLPKSAGVFVQVHDDVPVSFAVSAVQTARDQGFEQVTYVPAQ
jgi:biopolymer transport protein ExbD